MHKNLLKSLNLILMISFLVQTFTIVSKQFVRSRMIHELHELNGYILIILVFGHVVLNLGWFKQNYLKRKK
jgi:hypothetical protein